MAALSDMAEPLAEAPAFRGIKLGCGLCLHFAARPLYVVSGEKTLCSSPAVGKLAATTPCMHFEPNSMKMLDLPKAVQKAALKLAQTINAELQYKNRREEAGVVIATWAGGYAYSIGKGLPLGSDVCVTGSDIAGKLIHIDKDFSVILNDGIRYTVETKLVYADPAAKTKPVKEPREKKPAATKKATKKASARKTKTATGKSKTPRKAATKKATTSKKGATKATTKKTTAKTAAKAKKPAAKSAAGGRRSKSTAAKGAPVLGKMLSTLSLVKDASPAA